ncbi:hypothetical protein C0989_008128 [Termitomyces sp. Mn162]|nr:hypothetical protein C0989_008128 [Termitomyces sp. Mn162]
MKTLGSVAEGVSTAKGVKKIIDELGVNAPIANTIYHVLYHGESEFCGTVGRADDDCRQGRADRSAGADGTAAVAGTGAAADCWRAGAPAASEAWAGGDS